MHDIKKTDKDHDMQDLRPEPASLFEHVGVKLRVGVPHEIRLQNVAALPVRQEPSLVQIHFLTRRLEVQSHYSNRKKRERMS